MQKLLINIFLINIIVSIILNCTTGDRNNPFDTKSQTTGPRITLQPRDTTVTQGQAVQFVILAEGEDITYQWQKNEEDITVNSKGSIFTIESVLLSDNNDEYRCIVKNDGGTDTSEVVVLNVLLTKPDILSQPENTTVVEGDNVFLGVSALGDSINYQWLKNGEVLSGQTFDTLDLLSVQLSDSGYYQCVVYNNAGSDTSENVVVEFRGCIEKIYANTGSTFFLTNRGELFSCGENHGQFGNGSNHLSPVQIMMNVQSVSSHYHTLILKTDGSLFGCGDNGFGELGNGNIEDQWEYIHIMSNVQKVSAGLFFSLILKIDGSVWVCGSNSDGQLGDGTNSQHLTPVQVMTNVQDVAAGEHHSLFLKSDGTLWACGENRFCQIGDNTQTNRSIPVLIMNNVKSISAGSEHNLALKEDGTAWAFGRNEFGQLGVGDTLNRSNPIKIMSDVKLISAGNNHSLFLKTDGTLWGCGWNNFGELGDGTEIERWVPVQVNSDVHLVVASSSNYGYTIILKNDNTLWGCGWNYYGALGDGTQTTQITPVQISLP